MSEIYVHYIVIPKPIKYKSIDYSRKQGLKRSYSAKKKKYSYKKKKKKTKDLLDLNTRKANSNFQRCGMFNPSSFLANAFQQLDLYERFHK